MLMLYANLGVEEQEQDGIWLKQTVIRRRPL